MPAVRKKTMQLEFPTKTSRRLDAQGVSEAGTSLLATVEHNNDGAGSPEMSKGDGKNRGRRKKNGGGSRAL